jgi:peroxiredoxin
LPDFSRATLDGARFDTSAARGKVLVIKFFAKYCEPCKRTLPAVEAMHDQMPDVVVVGVAEDEHESDARQLVRQFGLTFPVVHDADNVLAGRYRVTQLPVTFVVDRNGTVCWVGLDAKMQEGVAAAVEAVP